MAGLITYLYEVSMILLVSGILYFLFFRNSSQLRLRRSFLLVSPLLAMIIPLLEFGFSPNSYGIPSMLMIPSALAGSIETLILPELTVNSSQVSSSELSSVDLLMIGYMLGMILLLLLLTLQFIKLGRLFFSKDIRSEVVYGQKVYTGPSEIPSFSFLSRIYFNPPEGLSEQDRKRILEHELVHVRQWHGLDILFLEVLRVLFWFHPVVWMYRTQLRTLHEYLADREMISSDKSEEYRSLLSRLALSSCGLSLGNYFSTTQTLNRLKMMTSKPKHVAKWKLGVSSIMLALLVIAFSCKEENISMAEASKNTSPDPENVAGISSQMVTDEPFMVVEERPEPKEGFNSFYSMIKDNISYPQEARNNGVEGRVMIRFIVDKKGNIIEPEVVKGIGSGCDEEALRVIKQSDLKWEPGKQDGKDVNAYVMLPVQFALD